MRRLRHVVWLLPLLVAGWWLWPASAAEHAAWLADFDRLEAHTARAYANLADRLASRGLSPRRLDETARAKLAAARNLRQARAAVAEFVSAFEDGHFSARAPYGPARRLLRRLVGKVRPRASASSEVAREADGDEVCALFGARDRRRGRVGWETLPGYAAIDHDSAADPFPAGVVARAGRPPLAILRIGLFSESGFPDFCAAAWERFRASLPAALATCAESCLEEFSGALERDFLARFAGELETLAAAGATTLLLDLTDNGGGRGIVSPMTRMLTAAPLPRRASAFIRHPHSVAHLSETAEAFRAELARADLTERQRAIVGAALARSEAVRDAAATPCDLSGMWRLASAAELPCSNLARSEPWAGELAPADLEGLTVSGELGANDDTVRSGVWPGALFVAVNQRTASASEDLVASLQDAGAARVVGERTMGVGCGYIDGGVELELPALGLTVKAPDCVRYRADGRNEAEGVLPDLAVAWNDDDSAGERAARFVAVLP